MNTSLQIADMRLPIGSLESYFYQINQIPILSAEEEYDFACRLQNQNDVSAAKALILPHLRYVARVAKGYLGYGLPLADLIQEGNIGLMKAVKRFKPEKGVRLVTFAMHWIKAEIHEYILKNWRIVKVATTKAQRKLFFNLRGLKKGLGWLTQQEVQDIATDLKVKPETVREMEMRLSSADTPFDAPHESEEDDTTFAPAAYLEDQRYNPAFLLEHATTTEHSQNNLYQALTLLDERSQDIIRTRWLAENQLTLQELADKYKVSAERIRQLEKNAMNKLKAAIQAA